MPDEKPRDITDFSRDELVRLVGMFFGDLLVHYGMAYGRRFVVPGGGILSRNGCGKSCQ